MTAQIATKLIDILTELERRLPPQRHYHYALSRELGASDAPGYQNRLVLTIFDGKIFRPFHLDDAHLAKSPTDLVDEIVRFMNQPAPSVPQSGNSPTGQAASSKSLTSIAKRSAPSNG